MGAFPIRPMAMMKFFAIRIFKPVVVVFWLIHGNLYACANHFRAPAASV